MAVIWRTTGLGLGLGIGVGVGITAGIVVICGVGCEVAVGEAVCVGEILLCNGISVWFTTWVGRTRLSGLLVLARKKAAYVPEATMTKERSTNPKTLILLGCVRLVTSVSLCGDKIILSLFDSCCSCLRFPGLVGDRSLLSCSSSSKR